MVPDSTTIVCCTIVACFAAACILYYIHRKTEIELLKIKNEGKSQKYKNEENKKIIDKVNDTSKLGLHDHSPLSKNDSTKLDVNVEKTDAKTSQGGNNIPNTIDKVLDYLEEKRNRGK